MSSSEQATTVRMSNSVNWLFPIGVAAAGTGLGFLVKPAFTWLNNTVGDAPGSLRLLALLPTTWAVVVLALLGMVGGFILAAIAVQESLVLTVDSRSVQLTQDKKDRFVQRDAIAAVFRDGKDLVLLGSGSKQLARAKASDLSASKVQEAFERFGYPWAGDSDPHEHEFQRWIDGHPALDEARNELLRTRARALEDKRPGSAAELGEQLQAAGVIVRDRDGAQQYRLVARDACTDR